MHLLYAHAPKFYLISGTICKYVDLFVVFSGLISFPPFLYSPLSFFYGNNNMMGTPGTTCIKNLNKLNYISSSLIL